MKHFLIISIVLLLFACDNGDMETDNSNSPLIGTWEGQNITYYSKITFERKNYTWSNKYFVPEGTTGNGEMYTHSGTWTLHNDVNSDYFTLHITNPTQGDISIYYTITDDVLAFGFFGSGGVIDHHKID